MAAATTKTFRCRQQGSALVITLLLLSIMSLLAINALRTATAETKLIDALLVAGNAFKHAELGIVVGLRFALEHPERLPTDTPLQLATIHADDLNRIETSIRLTALDGDCPMMAPLQTERLHYEIHATAISSVPTETTHVQAFYICREICTDPCLGAESMPVRSYWTINDSQ